MTTRPTMLPQTAELDAAKALSTATVVNCHNSETAAIDEFTRSGHLVYFAYAGAQYSLATLCTCADITLQVAGDGQPRDYLNATTSCPEHGAHQSTAGRCYETPERRAQAAFGWVEQRHARDHRVAWGMTHRGGHA